MWSLSERRWNNIKERRKHTQKNIIQMYKRSLKTLNREDAQDSNDEEEHRQKTWNCIVIEWLIDFIDTKPYNSRKSSKTSIHKI